jgi:protein TonB
MDAAVVESLRRVQPRDPFARWIALSALLHAAAVTATWLLAPAAELRADPARIVYVRLAPDPAPEPGSSPAAARAAPAVAAPEPAPAPPPAPAPAPVEVAASAPIPPPPPAPIEAPPPPEPAAPVVVASASAVEGVASDAAVEALPGVTAGPGDGAGLDAGLGAGAGDGAGSGAAAGSGAGSDAEIGSGEGGADALAAYVALVRERIEERKHYPAMARRRGLEGRVTVRIAIAPDGSVERASAVGGGVDLFVRATLEAVERAAPLPPPPPGFGDLEVTVRYELD